MNEQRKTMLTQSRLESQLESGIEVGEKLVPTGSLDRIGDELGRAETEFKSGRSDDIQSVIEQRRGQLGGFNEDEERIIKARGEETIARGEEMQRRRLSAIQAQAGVRGGTAANQQLQVLLQGQQQRTEFERDLTLENRRLQTESLGAFERSVQAAEQSEFARKQATVGVEQINLAQELRERELQQFNLAQASRERFAQLGVGFGLTQFGEASRSADKSIMAQMAAANAFGGKGK